MECKKMHPLNNINNNFTFLHKTENIGCFGLGSLLWLGIR